MHVAAEVPSQLQLSVFEAWHTALRGTLYPSASWRRRLGLQARELLLRRTRRPSVRDESLGVPGLLALTSDRLLFGTLRFRTVASLPAIRTMRATEGLLSDALLHLAVDDGHGSEVILRFGRGRDAKAQRDVWLASLELMRRAHAHSYALASDGPVVRAAHCAACAAALPDARPSLGLPLLQLLSAHPPRGVPGGGHMTGVDSGNDEWRLVRLSGATATAHTLRVACIAAAGDLLAVSVLGGQLILYRYMCAAEGGDGPCGARAAGQATAEETEGGGGTPPATPAVRPFPLTGDPADPHAPRAAPPAAADGELVTIELARVPCDAAATALSFAAPQGGGGARLLSLVSGAAHAWSSRLHASRRLDVPDSHRATHVVVATRRRAASLIAMASEHASDGRALRHIRVLELLRRSSSSSSSSSTTPRAEGDGAPLSRRAEAPGYSEPRLLVLPAAVMALAFCGERYLCVAHRAEYVLISLSSGTVRELFTFAPDYGAPFLARLSEAELLVAQPPPRAGERIVGLFLDAKGHVARRSTAHWRRPPRAALARAGCLLTLLPNAIEVQRSSHEPPRQTIAFPDACCANGTGGLLLVASSDSVFALLPPATPGARRHGDSMRSASSSYSYTSPCTPSPSAGTA